jgi:hypothetical protein
MWRGRVVPEDHKNRLPFDLNFIEPIPALLAVVLLKFVVGQVFGAVHAAKGLKQFCPH